LYCLAGAVFTTVVAFFAIASVLVVSAVAAQPTNRGSKALARKILEFIVFPSGM
jgi:hypothetical protein